MKAYIALESSSASEEIFSLGICIVINLCSIASSTVILYLGSFLKIFYKKSIAKLLIKLI